MTRTNPRVDAFLGRAERWRDELTQLRNIVLDCDLVEDLKWGQPCYTLQNKNIVIIHGFKEYCALLFMKGALLKDPNGILIQQTENVQSGRQIRFTHAGEIAQLAPILKAYIREAVQVEKSGLQVVKKATADYEVADEFQRRLDGTSALKAAFEALTPGRQRAYLLYFGGAKQSKTRDARIAKSIPRILQGKGLDD